MTCEQKRTIEGVDVFFRLRDPEALLAELRSSEDVLVDGARDAKWAGSWSVHDPAALERLRERLREDYDLVLNRELFGVRDEDVVPLLVAGTGQVIEDAFLLRRPPALACAGTRVDEPGELLDSPRAVHEGEARSGGVGRTEGGRARRASSRNAGMG